MYIVRLDCLGVGLHVRGGRAVAVIGVIEVSVAKISKAEVEGACIMAEWL